MIYGVSLYTHTRCLSSIYSVSFSQWCQHRYYYCFNSIKKKQGQSQRTSDRYTISTSRLILVTSPIAVKINTKVLTRTTYGRVYFDSQFKGKSNTIGNSWDPGASDGWSHCTRSQETERDKC